MVTAPSIMSPHRITRQALSCELGFARTLVAALGVMACAMACSTGCSAVLGLERAELASDAGPTQTAADGAQGEAATYGEAVVADGALAYYPLDEAAGADTVRSVVAGQATHERDGSVVGMTLGFDGARGAGDGSAQSQGVEARIDLGWQGVPSGNEPFSIELALRPDALVDEPRVVLSHSDVTSGSFAGYRLVVEGTTVRFERIGTDGSDAVRMDGALTAQTWTHVAVTFDGGRLRMIVSGNVADELRTTRHVLGSGARLVLGSASVDEAPFGGRLDEVAIYGREIPSDVLAAHASRLLR